MAKIRKISEYVNKVLTEFTIEYSTKKKCFKIALSGPLAKYAEGLEINSYIDGKSEEDVTTKLKTFIKEYVARSEVIRKVIVYELDWGSKNIELHTSTKHKYNVRLTEDARISIKYKVVMERDVNGNKTYFTTKTHNFRENEMEEFSERVDEDDMVIEWTAEREKFLTDMYAAMEALMRNLKKFAGTPEKLLSTIDSKMKLLEAPKHGAKK